MMNVRIIINALTSADEMENAEVWRGEIDVMGRAVYIAKVSIIAEGVAHPICDIPFSPELGYWKWVPPADLPPEPGDPPLFIHSQEYG
jgi:hypothetical protein